MEKNFVKKIQGPTIGIEKTPTVFTVTTLVPGRSVGAIKLPRLDFICRKSLNKLVENAGIPTSAESLKGSSGPTGFNWFH
jgi:hypothetical protein